MKFYNDYVNNKNLDYSVLIRCLLNVNKNNVFQTSAVKTVKTLNRLYLYASQSMSSLLTGDIIINLL